MDRKEKVNILCTCFVHHLKSIQKRKEGSVVGSALSADRIDVRSPCVSMFVLIVQPAFGWMCLCALSCKRDGTTRGAPRALVNICESENG